MLLALALCSCSQKEELSFIDYVNICVSYEFYSNYEETTILTIYTNENEIYYLTNVYYLKDFDNSVYKIEYISALNSDNELIIKEVQYGKSN